MKFAVAVFLVVLAAAWVSINLPPPDPCEYPEKRVESFLNCPLSVQQWRIKWNHNI
jgi:hypothetical protein